MQYHLGGALAFVFIAVILALFSFSTFSGGLYDARGNVALPVRRATDKLLGWHAAGGRYIGLKNGVGLCTAHQQHGQRQQLVGGLAPPVVAAQVGHIAPGVVQHPQKGGEAEQR